MSRPGEVLQRSVVEYLLVTKPQCLWYHPPNGGGRSKAEAGIFKAMGTRAGVPDLAFVLPEGQAAFIELKAKGRRLSPAQIEFRAAAEGLGAKYAVCYSIDEIKDALETWGVTFLRRAA